MLSEFKFDEGLVKLDDSKDEVHDKTWEKIVMIDRLKESGTSREEKNRLNEIFKKPLVDLIK